MLAEYAHVAAGVCVLRRKYRHRRGLAGSIAAEEAVDGVLFDVEADIVERECVLVSLGEVADLDHGVHFGPFGSVGAF